MELLLVCGTDPNGNEYTHPAHERILKKEGFDKIFVQKKMKHDKLRSSIIGDLRLDIDYNSNKNKEYDFIILEAPSTIIISDKLQNVFDAPILFMSSDWIFWPELAHDFHIEKNQILAKMMEKERKLKSWLYIRNLRKHVDGIISLSKLFDDMLNSIISKPSYVVNPPIDNKKYNNLGELSPDLDSNDAFFIGENRDHKGVDLLVSAWNELETDSILRIMGSGHKGEFDNIKNVETLGYVSEERMFDVMEMSGLYAHPARIDCNPVSALESIRAGVPTIVSTYTGTAAEIRKVDNKLIAKPEIKHIKDSISYYNELNKNARSDISSHVRDIGSKYTVSNSRSEFAEALDYFNAVL